MEILPSTYCGLFPLLGYPQYCEEEEHMQNFVWPKFIVHSQSCIGETCLVAFGLCSTALPALANVLIQNCCQSERMWWRIGACGVHRPEHGPRASVFHVPCTLLLHVFFSINVTFFFFLRLGLPALNVPRWARSPYSPVKPASVHICVLVASRLASSTGSWQNFTKRSVAASVWIFCTFCLKSCIHAESKNYFAFGCSLVAFQYIYLYHTCVLKSEFGHVW